MQKASKKRRPGSRTATSRRAHMNTAAESPTRPGPKRNPNRHTKN